MNKRIFSTNLFRTLIIAALVIPLALATVGSAMAQTSYILIQDTASGGQCNTIGVWTAATKTCTLNQDVSVPVRVWGQGITLDGGGFTMTPNGQFPSLELIAGGITVKNLNISGTDYYPGIQMGSSNNTITGVSVSNRYTGIYLAGAYNTIKDSIISGNSTGIYFDHGQYNTITNNVISDAWAGIRFDYISNSTISGNIITGSTYGVYTSFSSNNTLENNLIAYSSFAGIGLFGYYSDYHDNTITGNTVAYSTQGLFVYQIEDNLFYKNNLKNNISQVYTTGEANTWYREAPYGGNYWSDFDTPEEGCSNADGDPFCDAAYSVDSSHTDLLPWTNPIGGTGGAPVVTNILADPNPAPLNSEITLTAHVDSSSTGSTIVAAGYRLDDGAWDLWKLMTTSAGSYDSLTEDVQATILGFGEAGVHQVCVSAVNANGDTSLADNCISLVVGNSNNTAPTANPGGPYLGAVNTSIAFDGSLSSDPEGDALTYAWDFGDGETSTEAMPTHSYTATGVYNTCLAVSDSTLTSSLACTLVVVYDPSAGFVTGGGWIDSPTGAYMADPSLAGRATFGFQSKYQKGASVPTGNTAFAFDLATLSFASQSYEWLVVNQAGTNAQFKGSGLINGLADPNGNAYKFMLWAGDGAPDTFRIKIWWEDANGMATDVYDNDVDQAIGGGNIVVHTSK